MSKGLVFIHQSPSALLAHIEWTISGVCQGPITISWHALPDPGKGYRALALWDAPAVTRVHEAGLKCLSYTVNDPLLTKRLIDLGTDGIITDAVDVLGAHAVAP